MGNVQGKSGMQHLSDHKSEKDSEQELWTKRRTLNAYIHYKIVFSFLEIKEN